MTGSGTLADPFVIWDVNDLQDMRLLDGAHYELGADIDASATPGWFGGRGFEPVDWPFPQKRRPTGDFAAVGAWTVFPVAPPTRFDKVNEVDTDLDASYARVTAAGGTVLFTAPNFNIPAGSTNIRLLAYMVFRNEIGGGTTTFRGYIRVNGTNYQTAFTTNYSGNVNYLMKSARQFIDNPDTGLPWTADDINGVGPNPLQAWGVKVSGKECRISQIFCRVLCDPPTAHSFDGKGHTISGLFIDRATDYLTRSYGGGIGLFNVVQGGEIKNLNLTDIDFKGDDGVAGIAVTLLAPLGNISNCNVSGSIEATGNGAGGICGDLYYEGSNIVNCSFSGSIIGVSQVGGIVGLAHNLSVTAPQISNCNFNGEINGTGTRQGGIVGELNGIDVISCQSQGVITGADVGGIVGGLTNANITDSQSSATIHGTADYTGGLVGSAWTGVAPAFSLTLLRCQAHGDVDSAGDEVGGLGGLVDEFIIDQSLATGSVQGDGTIGGLVGSSSAHIINSYALGNVTGIAWRVGGLVGETWAWLQPIENSYSKGLVQGGPGLFGGLIGQNSGPTPVNNSFWDIGTSGQTVSAGGVGKTTEEMNHRDLYVAAGWDLDTVWNISQVTTGLSTNITPGTAMLNGLLNLTIINEAYPFLRWQTVVELPCDCGFEWGETVAFGNFTPIDSKNTGESFAKALAGLKPNTKHYFRAWASSSPGPIHGGIGTFTTLVGIEVETLPATNITENSARIWGRVRKVPITAMARFDWGGDIGYGAQTPWVPGLVSDDMFYHDLANLAEGRAYHFRAMAMGSALVYGNDMTFTTRSPLGPVTLIQEELAHIMEVP